MQVAKTTILCILILFAQASIAYGHRPVVVKNQSSKENPVQVNSPEISYAYYGELDGEPHYYKIVNSKLFTLYANILVPDFFPKSEAIKKHDMSLQILNDRDSIFIAEGEKSKWKRFYEKFGRQHYYMGPEFEQKVPEGTYYIKIFNKNNSGKYALAIGKKESFTPWGLIKALLKARSLDSWFFNPDTGGQNMEATVKMLIDFSKDNEQENWRVINDGVMGGISQSQIELTKDKNAVFQGMVSLENYGGFASIRTQPADYQLAGYDGMSIRIKGDGKKYQIRLRTDDRFDGVSYRSEFGTSSEEWITLNLPFDKFVPTFRGRIVPDALELAPEKIQQIGFLIADKQEGAFRIEIDWIGAYVDVGKSD